MMAPNPRTPSTPTSGPRRGRPRRRAATDGHLLTKIVALVLMIAVAAATMGPLYANAASGKETFTYTGAGTYVDFSSSTGKQAYCADATAQGPYGDSYAIWHYVGEAGKSALDGADPHALAWLVYHAYPNTSKIAGEKTANPMVATQTAIWMLQGRVNSSGYMANKNRNVVDTGEISRADLGLAWKLAQEARTHTGEAGPWDTAARLWERPSGSGLQNMIEVMPVGRIEIQKLTKDPSIVKGNGLYTLLGAKYGVWTNAACDSKHSAGTSITTDKDGHGVSGNLPQGTYYVKETTAPKGYALDPKVYQVSVTPGATTKVNKGSVPEVPLFSTIPLSIHKLDSEGSAQGIVAQGDAQTVDAQFTISYYAGLYKSLSEVSATPTRSWTVKTVAAEDGGSPVADLSDVCFVHGDERYQAEDGTYAIPLGTVVIEETQAPEGYRDQTEGPVLLNVVEKNGACVVVDPVSSDEWTQDSKAIGLDIKNEVMRGGLRIAKHDGETGERSPLGAATLAGATYSVETVSASPVIVDGTAHQRGEVVATLTTDDSGAAELPGDALPYGTYRIYESKAPAGYTLTSRDEWCPTFTIRSDGEVAELVDGPGAPQDQVIRGDLEFNKIRSGDARRLANVPFLITSASTGEAHLLVTDENGVASTASSAATHARATNANDQALGTLEDGTMTVTEDGLDPEAGVWFSGRAGSATTPQDGLGALPFDTYRVTELPCTANDGLELLEFQIVVKRHDTVVDGGTLTNHALPAIETTLTEPESASHMAKASAKTTLVDTVRYERLKTDGTAYELRGTLHVLDEKNGDAGPALDASGAPITSAVALTPRLSAGEAEVSFTFDSTAFEGKVLVCFEELLQNGKVIATHADPTDTQQMVSFPKVSTSLADSAGGKEALAEANVTLVDTVSYSGLVPGLEYRLEGALETPDGKPVTHADGSAVTATASFVPSEAAGSVDVTFTLDGRSLRGQSVVATESLYLEDRLVAEHNDPSSKEQTVAFPAISTKASADVGDAKDAKDAGQVTLRVTDIVTYKGLTPGNEYRLEAQPIDLATGKPLADADGKPLQATVTFTPKDADGTAEVPMDLTVSASEGTSFVMFERLFSSDRVIATHEDLGDLDQTVSQPKIQTKARDSITGTQMVEASEGAVIVDEVSYSGLVPDQTYELTARICNRTATSNADEPQMLEQTASVSFTPKAPMGTVEVEIPVDAQDLGGQRLVVFESLSLGGETVATHETVDCDDQTVWVTRLETVAKDSQTSGKTVPATGKRTIVDTVTYRGLIPGKEYVIEGSLMDKRSGQPLTDAAGKAVAGRTTFTPEEADGEASVAFEVDTSGLAGHSIVAFERLSQDEVLIARHEDIESKAQTVLVEEDKPKVDRPKDKGRLPKTGVGPEQVAAAVVGAVMLVGVAVSGKRR